MAQISAAGVRGGAQNTIGTPAKSPAEITISGLVRQPLHFGLGDLRTFNSVTVRRVDYRSEGYFGDFEFCGVPLSTLISLAGPRKESSSFMRPTDLAIIVRNDAGKRALFSYGELLFRPPSDIVLAFEAEPVIPRRGCGSCHGDRSSHAWREMLGRKQALPRIIAGRDFDADRSLEGVTRIEVVELFSPGPRPKTGQQQASSQGVEVGEGTAVIGMVRNLDAYPRHRVHALEVGDAMGFHGEVKCEGALLSDVLTASRAPSGPDVGYVIAATDGFRAMLSSAELFSTALAPPILLVDRCNDKPVGKAGEFKAIVANDSVAERWVKSVATIHSVRATLEGTH